VKIHHAVGPSSVDTKNPQTLSDLRILAFC
jgi:hypothetical protein